MVCALYGEWKILKAPSKSPPDVWFRHVVSTGEDAIADTSEVDFDAFGADVDQHDLEAAHSRLYHHLQIAAPRERSLHCETFASNDMLFADRRTWRADAIGTAEGTLA